MSHTKMVPHDPYPASREALKGALIVIPMALVSSIVTLPAWWFITVPSAVVLWFAAGIGYISLTPTRISVPLTTEELADRDRRLAVSRDADAAFCREAVVVLNSRLVTVKSWLSYPPWSATIEYDGDSFHGRISFVTVLSGSNVYGETASEDVSLDYAHLSHLANWPAEARDKALREAAQKALHHAGGQLATKLGRDD